MKRFLFLGLGIVIGGAAGAGLSYIFTKNACEKRTQEAIDEMKHFYEDGAHKTVKGFEIKEGSDEKKTEERTEVVRLDKPPISEMSSLVNSDSDSTHIYTNYHMQGNSEEKEKEVDDTIESIKKHIKEITDKPVESVERFAVVNRSEYIKKVNSGYSTRDYSFDTADEHWIDQMSGTDIEVEELPFDPVIIQWDELEQCYIADEVLQSVYMVERI